MKAQQSGRRITLEKIYMTASDLSTISVSLPQLGETVEYAPSAWVGIFKPFESIRMECTLPLDVVVRATRIPLEQLDVVIGDGSAHRTLTLSVDGLGVFAGPIAYIDSIDDNHLVGWAWDPGHAGPITVTVRSGTSAQKVLANRYRADLDMLGIGLGLHGFKCLRLTTLPVANLEVVYENKVIGRLNGD